VGSSQPNPARPVIGSRLRHLVRVVFILTALLAANSLYLVVVTALEQLSGDSYQDYLYLVMFLIHLLLGLALILPLVLHMRNAWRRPNRYAVRAGATLYLTALLLLISGVLLTRFGFLEINDPTLRGLAYWIHVISPLLVAWLFVLHRLAGRKIRWRTGGYWSAATLLLLALLLTLQIGG